MEDRKQHLKYKVVLQRIHKYGWDASSDKILNGDAPQDIVNAIYYGVNNDILNESSTHVVCDGSGSPCHAQFSAYPFTPYGEDWLKSDSEKRTNTIKEEFLKETGKIWANWVWALIGVIFGAGGWAVLSHFVLRNIVPNFQW